MTIKKIFLLLTCFLISGMAAAQQAPEAQEKIHIDQQERVYVKASKGVYFFISDSPDPAQAVPLKSTVNPELTNPMYFDGHGKHYLRHKDLHEDVEVVYEVYADKYAPVSTLDFGREPDSRQAQEWFFSQAVQVSQQAKDDLSGVRESFISIDGAPFKKNDGSLQLDQEKTYALIYYAEDQVGNREAPKTLRVTLDMTEPATRLQLKNNHSENTVSGRTGIELKAEDQSSGVQATYFSVNKGEMKRYRQPVSTHGMKEGKHILSFYSIDKAGNREEAQQLELYVDNTPPIVNADVIGDSFISGKKKYSSSRTKMKITALDNKAGVQAVYYSLNNGEYQKYEKPFYLPADKGNVTVKAYAVDKVNNKSEVSYSGGLNSDGLVYMDLNGPSLNHRVEGPAFKMRDTTYVNNHSRIKLIARDQESGLRQITYRIDGGTEKTYVEPFSIEQEGLHTIEFYGYDNVNNLNKSTFNIIVDKTGPQIFSRPSMKPLLLSKIVEKQRQKYEVYAPHLSLFLSATDSKVGSERLYYSINGSDFIPYQEALSGFDTGNIYRLEVKALDKLGNEALHEFTFQVE